MMLSLKSKEWFNNLTLIKSPVSIMVQQSSLQQLLSKTVWWKKYLK